MCLIERTGVGWLFSSKPCHVIYGKTGGRTGGPEPTDGWKGGQTNGRTRTDGQTEGRTDERTDQRDEDAGCVYLNKQAVSN